MLSEAENEGSAQKTKAGTQEHPAPLMPCKWKWKDTKGESNTWAPGWHLSITTLGIKWWKWCVVKSQAETQTESLVAQGYATDPTDAKGRAELAAWSCWQIEVASRRG